MKILVPRDQVKERLEAYFAKLARRVTLPGFRSGKAPAHLVKQRYKDEAASDVSENLISEFVARAVQERKLDLVAPPVLVATDLPEETRDFSFEVEVDLRPKVPEIQLKGLEIEVGTDAEVTDEDVARELTKLQEREVTYKDSTENRAVRADDCIVVKFEGEIDGEKPASMTAESQTMVLGQGQLLPDFETGLVGMKLNEVKTFPVKFPADYHAPELQNKTANFTATLLGLKERVAPELNDEFAKSVDEELSSLDELKTRLRKQLAEHKTRVHRQELRDRLGDLLVAKHPFDVSKRQVERFAESLAEQAHHSMHQMGVQHEETEDLMKSLFQSSLQKAERDVRLSYILESIGREQKFEVTDEDLEKRYQQTSERTGISLAQVKSYYAGKDEDASISRIERLKIDILDEKSLDYALSQATIKKKGSIDR